MFPRFIDFLDGHKNLVVVIKYFFLTYHKIAIKNKYKNF